MPDLLMDHEEHQVTITGADFQVVFDKLKGVITTYQSHGHELIKAGPRENYYRAPTDFDLLMGNPPASIHKWRNAGLDQLQRRVVSFEAVKINPKLIAVSVQATISAPDRHDGIDSQIIYYVYGNGSISVSNKVSINERMPYVPRVGVELVLPHPLETLSWFGRGPHENYVDRKTGATVGYYMSTVTEQFTPYVYPSECGGKEDTRWLALTDRDGIGLLIVGLDKLHFDALHYFIHDLEQAKHLDALHPVDEVILHLDGRHMGVGGDDGWMARVHNEFLIFPGRYHFAFQLKPLTGQDDPSVLARMIVEGDF